MQHTLTFLFTAALALAVRYSHGLALPVQQTPSRSAVLGKAVAKHGLTVEKRDAGKAVASSGLRVTASNETAQGLPVQSKTSAKHTVLAQKVSSHMRFRRYDPVLVRPNAKEGLVDKVNVGVIVKTFFGTHLQHHTFSIDMVMTARWHDPRVVKFINKSHDKLSMAWSQALELLWMPGIVVTNRDIESYEIVSASVTIFRSGEVVRVERARAEIMKKYELEAYPFDTQHLAVNIASSKYMSNEVVLIPDTNASGVAETQWGGYELEGWHTESLTARDGNLKKSRFVLEADVQRSGQKYYEEHLVPAFIALTISWAVFYFPFANPFITPRLALSVLALLVFTNLMVQSSKALPGAAPFNWNDLFNQQIQSLMFLTIVLNISSEIATHSYQNEKLGKGINNQAKLFVPLLSVLNIVIILGSGKRHWMTLDHATNLTKAALVMFCACWFAKDCYSFDLHRGLVQKVKGLTPEEVAAASTAGGLGIAAAAGGGGQGDADCDAGGDGGDGGC